MDKRKMRIDAISIFELTKSFTTEPSTEAMRSCLKMADYVMRLTNDIDTFAPTESKESGESEGGEVPEMPKEMKEHLETKMRPYHSKLSFKCGAVETWEYLYHRDQSTITALHDEVDCLKSEIMGYEHGCRIRNEEIAALQQERDAFKDKWERAQKDIAALTEQIKAQ